MSGLRGLLRARAWPAALFLLLALAARLAVPAGYMPMAAPGKLLLVPCSGHGPVLGMPAMPGHGHDREGSRHSELPCGFAALADLGTSDEGALPLLPTLAPVAVRALIAVPAPPRTASLRLRPPLRAPPA